MLNITIYNEVLWQCPLPTSKCKALIAAMLNPYAHLIHNDKMSLNVHFVHDAQISELNLAHMQSNGPTNVLSFPAHMTQNFNSKKYLQKIEHPDILVISIDTLKRECLLYGQGIHEHMIRLLAHGLLHLLGYEHGEEMFDLCAQMENVGQDFLQRF